jgi:flagellar basal-body rod protein FlgC
MGMFSTINIASSGLSVQRLRQDIIADNIANAESTRTPEGGAYRRRRLLVEHRRDGGIWRSTFFPKALDNGVGNGVQMVEIQKDTDQPLRLVYDPSHPDAIKEGPKAGYVEYPNVNLVNEMVDLISASRSYDANVTLINSAKASFQRALEIGR